MAIQTFQPANAAPIPQQQYNTTFNDQGPTLFQTAIEQLSWLAERQHQKNQQAREFVQERTLADIENQIRKDELESLDAYRTGQLEDADFANATARMQAEDLGKYYSALGTAALGRNQREAEEHAEFMANSMARIRNEAAKLGVELSDYQVRQQANEEWLQHSAQRQANNQATLDLQSQHLASLGITEPLRHQLQVSSLNRGIAENDQYSDTLDAQAKARRLAFTQNRAVGRAGLAEAVARRQFNNFDGLSPELKEQIIELTEQGLPDVQGYTIPGYEDAIYNIPSNDAWDRGGFFPWATWGINENNLHLLPEHFKTYQDKYRSVIAGQNPQSEADINRMRLMAEGHVVPPPTPPEQNDVTERLGRYFLPKRVGDYFWGQPSSPAQQNTMPQYLQKQPPQEPIPRPNPYDQYQQPAYMRWQPQYAPQGG